jgi:hypothetical protein
LPDKTSGLGQEVCGNSAASPARSALQLVVCTARTLRPAPHDNRSIASSPGNIVAFPRFSAIKPVSDRISTIADSGKAESRSVLASVITQIP